MAIAVWINTYTTFLGGFISITTSYFDVHQRYKVLIHPHTKQFRAIVQGATCHGGYFAMIIPICSIANPSPLQTNNLHL